ncbi:MAG TPA: phosphatidate cytidylyltransferase, partial [Verrucomicrobiae bacterium]|nr:phosphatidate cytidylyltransferase [Verrucomicrobiae bacterium]
MSREVVVAPVPGASTPGSAAGTAAATQKPRVGFFWRLVSSIVLWGIMLAVVFWLPPTGLYVFMNLVIARALWEFYGICEVKGLRAYKRWGVLGAVALISGSWFIYGQRHFTERWYDFDVFILLVFAIGVFIRQFPQKQGDHGIESMSVTLFGLIYVAWLCNFVTRINFAATDGRYWVMYLVVVTKFTDIGAYLVGSALGRHRMIPRISPKKTWEGTVGGLVFALGGSLLCFYSVTPQLAVSGLSLQHAVVLGLLLGVTAVIGDLAES